MNIKLILIAVITVLVLFIIGIWVRNASVNSHNLSGAFVADPEFLKESGLKGMIVMVGPGRAKRTINAIMNTDEGSMDIVGPVRQITPTSFLPWAPKKIVSYWYPQEEEVSKAFAEKIKVEYYPKIGKMIWSGNEQVLAVLYRDGIASEDDEAMHEEQPEDEE